MNLRSTAICLDCDELIDLSETRKEEKCPKCGSKDHTKLSKYIQPLPAIRVNEIPTVKKAGKIGRRNRRRLDLKPMEKLIIEPAYSAAASKSVM